MGAQCSIFFPSSSERHKSTQRPNYGKARRLIPSNNPPWLYGFSLDYDFLVDTYDAKFIPMPPGPDLIEQDMLTIAQRRVSESRANLTIECKVWPEMIGVVAGLSKPSGRTGVLALFPCVRHNKGSIPTDEERVQLEVLKEILVSEDFSFPNELSAWFVAM